MLAEMKSSRPARDKRKVTNVVQCEVYPAYFYTWSELTPIRNKADGSTACREFHSFAIQQESRKGQRVKSMGDVVTGKCFLRLSPIETPPHFSLLLFSHFILINERSNRRKVLFIFPPFPDACHMAWQMAISTMACWLQSMDVLYSA